LKTLQIRPDGGFWRSKTHQIDAFFDIDFDPFRRFFHAKNAAFKIASRISFP